MSHNETRKAQGSNGVKQFLRESQERGKATTSANTSMAAKTGEHHKGSGRARTTYYLPYPEYTKRREADLCYHFGLAFGPGHHCVEKHLRVVILKEDEDVNEDGKIVKIEAISSTNDDTGVKRNPNLHVWTCPSVLRMG